MTIKEYKKRYYICKDDFGNKLYAGDTVELYCPIELSTKWVSKIHWNMLYGAYVDYHLAHKKIFNDVDKQRPLYTLLNQYESQIYIDSDSIKVKGYVKKIKSFNK